MKNNHISWNREADGVDMNDFEYGNAHLKVMSLSQIRSSSLKDKRLNSTFTAKKDKTYKKLSRDEFKEFIDKCDTEVEATEIIREDYCRFFVDLDAKKIEQNERTDMAFTFIHKMVECHPQLDVVAVAIGNDKGLKYAEDHLEALEDKLHFVPINHHGDPQFKDLSVHIYFIGATFCRNDIVDMLNTRNWDNEKIDRCFLDTSVYVGASKQKMFRLPLSPKASYNREKNEIKIRPSPLVHLTESEIEEYLPDLHDAHAFADRVEPTIEVSKEMKKWIEDNLFVDKLNRANKKQKDSFQSYLAIMPSATTELFNTITDHIDFNDWMGLTMRISKMLVSCGFNDDDIKDVIIKHFPYISATHHTNKTEDNMAAVEGGIRKARLSYEDKPTICKVNEMIIPYRQFASIVSNKPNFTMYEIISLMNLSFCFFYHTDYTQKVAFIEDGIVRIKPYTDLFGEKHPLTVPIKYRLEDNRYVIVDMRLSQLVATLIRNMHSGLRVMKAHAPVSSDPEVFWTYTIKTKPDRVITKCPESLYKLCLSLVGVPFDKTPDQDAIGKAEYLLDYLALRLQHPEKRMSIAIIISSVPGVGKGLLGKFLTWCMTDAYCNDNADGSDVLGHFNTILEDKLIIIMNEFDDADSKMVSAFKKIITEDTQSITSKGVDTQMKTIYASFMVFTNKTTMPLIEDENDRRITYFASQLGRRIKDEEFNKYFDDSNKGLMWDKEDCFDYLLSRDVSGKEGYYHNPYPYDDKVKLFESRRSERAPIIEILDYFKFDEDNTLKIVMKDLWRSIRDDAEKASDYNYDKYRMLSGYMDKPSMTITDHATEMDYPDPKELEEFKIYKEFRNLLLEIDRDIKSYGYNTFRREMEKPNSGYKYEICRKKEMRGKCIVFRTKEAM